MSKASKKNRSILILTDGTASTKSQTFGLAQYLTSNPNLIDQKIISLKPLWSLLPPAIAPVSHYLFNENLTDIQQHDIIISCGRKTVSASIYLKRKFKEATTTIHVQDPRVSARFFDYIIAPSHDRIRGDNVLHSQGALHLLSKDKITNANSVLRTMNFSGKTVVGILLGGENKHYSFSTQEVNSLIDRLMELEKNHENLHFVIISSRRTPQYCLDKILAQFSDRHTVLTENKRNEYLTTLDIADYLIVTSDSISMVSEAAYTAKSLYVYHLPWKRKSPRMHKFHQQFSKLCITKPLGTKLEKWSYGTIDEAAKLAELIESKMP